MSIVGFVYRAAIQFLITKIFFIFLCHSLKTVRDFEFAAAGCPLHFTISIGLATTDSISVQSDSELIELADKAMYLAKKSGRNQYCVANDVVAANEETVVADVPVLALQAMAQHRDIPGRRRLSVVRALIRAYEPLERQAERGGKHERLWSRLGDAAVAATWRLPRGRDVPARRLPRRRLVRVQVRRGGRFSA